MLEKVIGILFPVFAIVLVGYAIAKLLKPDFKPINRINMDVFCPALIFSSLVMMKPLIRVLCEELAKLHS